MGNDLKDRLGTYGIIQQCVIPKVGGSAFKVYAALTTFGVVGEKDCWPSVRTLGMLTQLSDSTVQRALRELESKGIVTRKAEMGEDGRTPTSNRYILNVVAREPDVDPLI